MTIDEFLPMNSAAVDGYWLLLLMTSARRIIRYAVCALRTVWTLAVNLNRSRRTGIARGHRVVCLLLI